MSTPRPARDFTPMMTRARWTWVLLATFVMLWFWSVFGEPWETTSDSALYLRMALGDSVQAPFGYRIFSPGVVSLLPFQAAVGFTVLSWVSLMGAGAAMFVYALTLGRSAGEHRPAAALAWVTLGFFVTSYAYSYYGSVKLSDLPMLAVLAVSLALLARGRTPWLVGLLLATAVLAHETALVLLPILWLDRLLGAGALGRRKLSWGALVLITGCGLASYAGSRSLIPVAPAGEQVSYLTTPQAMSSYVLNYSGGLVRHGQRIYAAFGPALVFALLAGVFSTRGRARLFVPGVVLFGVVLTFLATDTLRVMAVVFPIVLLFAGRLVVSAWESRGAGLALSLGAAQLVYSWLVFGHLRSFESSATLQLAAVAVSAVAAVLGLLAVIPAGRRLSRGPLDSIAAPVRHGPPQPREVGTGA